MLLSLWERKERSSSSSSSSSSVTSWALIDLFRHRPIVFPKVFQVVFDHKFYVTATTPLTKSGLHVAGKLTENLTETQDRQGTYHVTLRRVRATNVAVEKR